MSSDHRPVGEDWLFGIWFEVRIWNLLLLRRFRCRMRLCVGWGHHAHGSAPLLNKRALRALPFAPGRRLADHASMAGRCAGGMPVPCRNSEKNGVFSCRNMWDFKGFTVEFCQVWRQVWRALHLKNTIGGHAKRVSSRHAARRKLSNQQKPLVGVAGCGDITTKRHRIVGKLT